MSKDVKHTPGPWRADGGDGTLHMDGCELHGVNAAALSPPASSFEEAMANARLIAAAPELLGALRFILAFYEPGQRHLDTEAWKNAEASARLAVAKAEGRASRKSAAEAINDVRADLAEIMKS